MRTPWIRYAASAPADHHNHDALHLSAICVVMSQWDGKGWDPATGMLYIPVVGWDRLGWDEDTLDTVRPRCTHRPQQRQETTVAQYCLLVTVSSEHALDLARVLFSSWCVALPHESARVQYCSARFARSVVTLVRGVQVFGALGMVRERAQLSQERASEKLASWRASLKPARWSYATSSEEEDEAALALLLQSMGFLAAAASSWAQAGAGRTAALCVARTALVGHQVHVQDTLVGVPAAAAMALAQQQGRLQEAVVIACAYDLTSESQWADLLWHHLEKGRATLPQFLVDWCHTLPLPASLAMEMAERVGRAVGGGAHVPGPAAYRGDQGGRAAQQLGSAFRSLLRLVPDLELRQRMAATSRVAPSEMETCLELMDRNPPIGAPLVLRRGHGGAILPLM